MKVNSLCFLRCSSVILCVFLSGSFSLVQALDIYVSPGSGAAVGKNTFSSITAARDSVRDVIAEGMKEDITVHLAAGNYFIEEPILLDERDSGRDGHVVIYKGAPDLGTKIYGGRRITNWQKLNDCEYAAEVVDLQQHFTLYENEQAANGGIFHAFPGAPEGDWRREGIRLVYHPRNLPIEDQVIVLGTAKDVFRINGSSMEKVAGNIVFDGLYMIGSDFAPEWKKGDSYFATWDGEYDGRPWKGQKLGDSVIAPDMRHGQFYIENARNVVIRNSKLYGAGFMGAMYNLWAQECVVENCWIENAGCNGLFFMGWECGRGPFKSVAESYVNKKHVVRNNVFYDIGRFSNYAAGMYFNFSGDNLVEHNIFRGITHYAVTLKGWRPMLINEFHLINRDIPDVGPLKPYDMDKVKIYGEYVVTAKNQGADVLHSRNTVVRYNDMSQIARFGDDMGMISMWGAGTGNVWEFNACHDGVNVSGWEHWLHVLFNDDGSHDAAVRGNIVYWITGGGRSRAIMLKGNRQNTYDNIVADCILSGAATIGPYVEQAHEMVWSRNIVAAQIGCLYFGGGGEETVDGVKYPILREADNNVYYYKNMNDSAVEELHQKRIRDQVEGAKSGGKKEQNSIYADPMFDRKNPWWAVTYEDYKLKPESPALQMGFKQTDLERIGLLNNYPFDVAEVFAHPAGRIWKAGNWNRIYKTRTCNQQICAYNTRGIARGAWIRYDAVDFGDGGYNQFRARIDWLPPKRGFETTLDGKTIAAMELGDSWCPIPYWQVSPAYAGEGKKGPELIDVQFAPEKDPASVKWTVVTEPLVSRATVRHPLGVVNCDVVNGEERSNSAAYMRSCVYAVRGGRTGIEIRGAHGVKVWLNGEQIFSQVGNVEKSPRVDVSFKQGWNEFLVKVVQDDRDWAPAMQGYGNFWASVTMHYSAVGNAFILPGVQGKEIAIMPESDSGVEMRLDSPDGKLIGHLKYGKSTCEADGLKGRHDLYLVFPDERVQSLDWFRFEKGVN